MTVARFRRSPGLVVFWQRGALAYFDAVSGQRRTLPASMMALLNALNDWTSAADLQAQDRSLGTRAVIVSLLRRMERLGLIEREGKNGPWPWDEWAPEAAFFHFATRDSNYPADFLDHETSLQRKAQTNPQPAPTKQVDGAGVSLPAAATDGGLTAALLARRTWRSLSGEPIELADLSTLLGLTFGVQRSGRVLGQGPVVFKTSPSGGARHPIEAYVIANRVASLAPAIYHYDAARHLLVRVGKAVQSKRLIELLANQYYFGNCSAAVVMTACVGRTMWRYPFARAYRSVLIEAGHLGQTFCLLATQLGLAPFTTIAFRDSDLEHHLAVDGRAETAIYVAGVGTRLLSAADRPGQIPGRHS